MEDTIVTPYKPIVVVDLIDPRNTLRFASPRSVSVWLLGRSINRYVILIDLDRNSATTVLVPIKGADVFNIENTVTEAISKMARAVRSNEN